MDAEESQFDRVIFAVGVDRIDTFQYISSPRYSEGILEDIGHEEDSLGCSCVGVCGSDCVCGVNGFVFDECSSFCSCDFDCTNRQLQNGVFGRLQIFDTTEYGIGVRTLKSISKGSFICEYIGEVLTLGEALDRCKESYDTSYMMTVDAKDDSDLSFVIDAKRFGNIGRFVNHSCNPNVETRQHYVQGIPIPRIGFFATREIDENEQITWSYIGNLKDRPLPTSGPERFVECRCGEPECIKYLPLAY